VCLGRDFGGAGLRFCGRFGSVDHRTMQVGTYLCIITFSVFGATHIYTEK
jgi:hypothetical protein